MDDCMKPFEAQFHKLPLITYSSPRHATALREKLVVFNGSKYLQKLKEILLTYDIPVTVHEWPFSAREMYSLHGPQVLN
jgi:hypothetical protein